MKRPLLLGTATGAALLLLAAPVSAHISTNPDEIDGRYVKTDFRVPHGCEGEATTALRIQIPDGVSGARPQEVPDWDIEVERDGEEAVEIAWTGGELPDQRVQEFGLNMSIDEDAPDVIYFPTIQECGDVEHAWIELPDSIDEWGELDEPAPYLQRVDEDEDEDAGEDAAAPDDEVEAAADSAGGTDPLTYGALAAGVLGLIAGITALFRSRRA